MALASPLLLEKTLDLLLDLVCVVDPQGRFVYVSAACQPILGYSPEELLGSNMIDLVHPEDRERTRAVASQINEGMALRHFENRYLHKDGHDVWMSWSARWSEDDKLRLAVGRDVTVHHQSRRQQQALYRISEAAHDAEGLAALYQQIHRIIDELLPVGSFAVVLYDADNLSIPYWSGSQPPKALLLDSALSEVITQDKAVLRPGGEEPDWLGVPLRCQRGVMGALVVQAKGQEGRFQPHQQELLQFVSIQVATAIERKQTEAQLKHMAGHDPLTLLPNRTLFHDRLAMAMARAQRHRLSLALLYLDLNDFKAINDNHGHDAGDKVLCEVARRLTEAVRSSDTVARLGGDEFIVLMTEVKNQAQAGRLVDKLSAALLAPVQVADQAFNLSASIGLALYPEHGEDSSSLLRHADASMYCAKGRGR
ncbi:diguanylate cyclase [Gallaecimonas kandeliae]|uniref:sensor domain-containing protein n=1 Tax=Gallaecimonas kandeliae TaxID=3029055 RepID=UPI002649AC28|nr:diguanylate cyclase [Gallaecimonas kandeliae]WKE64798.1 diguanylate cyclase [Gallaecimonas kandeliae]